MRKITHPKIPAGTNLLAAVAWLMLLTGCQPDGPPRYRVSGTVTFDGQPVPYGMVIFTPDASKGNSGPQGAATIIDGKFDTGRDKGTVGGPHELQIDGVSQMPTAENPSVAPLFQNYLTKEELPKENHELNLTVPTSARAKPQRPNPRQRIEDIP